jgi:arylsulfatase A-like enzyme
MSNDRAKKPCRGRWYGVWTALTWVGLVAARAMATDASAPPAPAGQHEAGVAPSPGAPRLVILYAPCSVAKGYLQPYQAAVTYTPAIGAFARQALVFDRHQTEAGQSGTAYAALFTGEQASRHGILRHPAFLNDDLYTITEAFRDAGYDVHAWLKHHMASSALHYGQGVPPAQAHNELLEADAPAFEAILDRLERDPQYRAFVVTAFTVSHSPYPAPKLDEFCHRYPKECGPRADEHAFERDRELFTKNFLPLALNYPGTVARLGLGPEDVTRLAATVEVLYEASIFHLDLLFGRMIQAIDEHGLGADSLIAFTADHGEVLYRDNAALKWTHGHQLAPEVLGVPFLLRGGSVGVRPGRYPAVTRSVDVFPTLAGLAGILLPAVPTKGENLAAAVRGTREPPQPLAYSHSALYPGPIKKFPRLTGLLGDNTPDNLTVAVRRNDDVWALHRGSGMAWEGARYDLATDPAERRNLFDPSNPVDKAMLAKLRRYKASLIAGAATVRARREAAEAAKRRLRAMGYIE